MKFLYANDCVRSIRYFAWILFIVYGAIPEGLLVFLVYFLLVKTFAILQLFFRSRKLIPAKSYYWGHSRKNTEKRSKFAWKSENLAKTSFNRDCLYQENFCYTNKVLSMAVEIRRFRRGSYAHSKSPQKTRQTHRNWVEISWDKYDIVKTQRLYRYACRYNRFPPSHYSDSLLVTFFRKKME